MMGSAESRFPSDELCGVHTVCILMTSFVCKNLRAEIVYVFGPWFCGTILIEFNHYITVRKVWHATEILSLWQLFVVVI